MDKGEEKTVPTVYQYRTRKVGDEWCPVWHNCSEEHYMSILNGSLLRDGWEYEVQVVDTKEVS